MLIPPCPDATTERFRQASIDYLSARTEPSQTMGAIAGAATTHLPHAAEELAAVSAGPYEGMGSLTTSVLIGENTDLEAADRARKGLVAIRSGTTRPEGRLPS